MDFLVISEEGSIIQKVFPGEITQFLERKQYEAFCYAIALVTFGIRNTKIELHPPSFSYPKSRNLRYSNCVIPKFTDAIPLYEYTLPNGERWQELIISSGGNVKIDSASGNNIVTGGLISLVIILTDEEKKRFIPSV